MMEQVKVSGSITFVNKKEVDKKDKLFIKVKLENGLNIRCYSNFEQLVVGKYLIGECEKTVSTNVHGTFDIYACKNPTIMEANAKNMPSVSAPMPLNRVETNGVANSTFNALKANSVPNQAMWDDKERRELRKTIWDTCFMTIYKTYETETLSKNDILPIINAYAEAGFKFVYEKPESDDEFIKRDTMAEKEDIEIPFK